MPDHVNVVIPPLAQPLTYLVPATSRDQIRVGSLVQVPLGRRRANGFVVKLVEGGSDLPENVKIKSIENPETAQRCFPESQLPFFEWIADYYAEPLSQVLDVAIPPAAPRRTQRWISLTENELPPPRGKNQQQIIETIRKTGGPVEYTDLANRLPNVSASLKRLVSAGYLAVREESAPLQGVFDRPLAGWAKTDVSLSADQISALQAICASIESQSFQPYCLRGVTGSGKTEVYIEAIRATLAAGRSAIVIVPEIALTPQLIERFRARLEAPVSVLHSGLSKRDRWEAWLSLLEGKSSIVIGARSAIFAPVRNLGIIIVDEEHDSSYKQGEGLRYHARDLAVVRAKLSSCPVLLGSATPSAETYNNCLQGRYRELLLPDRFAASQQLMIDTIDLTRTKLWEMASENVSLRLAQELDRCLAAGDQAFILYNRRGFASFLQCVSCGTSVQCPNCSVSLTYHRHSHALLCHYCGLSRSAPNFCPSCGGEPAPNESAAAPAGSAEPAPGTLVQRGAGTERVFDELRNLFPQARIDRLDRDAAAQLADYERILERVRNRETQILVGTQMIAKGHDLPSVTLVGIIDCDVGLHMPDFRAGERAFQLLTQCAGRAGRGAKAGRVLLQTRLPEHPSLARTKADDYLGFIRSELSEREALRYPPFSRMLRVIISSTERNLPAAMLAELREAMEIVIDTLGMQVSILGPAPAPIVKIKALWRHHLLLKSSSTSALQRLLHQFKGYFAKQGKARVVFDVDPQEMM